ncbi:zinc ribbon domain-containing protein [Dehalococcoidia bacterium]|nr:zinc ribbon domain-containing protein [Dehalococcoidia bacterium]
MTEHQYSCEKCHSTGYKTGEIRTTGSGLSRFLNLQNQKFTAISCDKCGYTDLFRTDGGGKIGNIFDVLTN